ncbi:PepSY-associated TM helix domain-containing protein [Niveispirillum fermenti]|uniref:PepSY-associated TM helix domain-containing protein n=1 Tax=Niveispirillum fermenti TaxID=1233113 RepID=UPI003A880E5B
MTKSTGRRGLLIRLHRWLGLGAALFWLVQAVTGTLLSFHFELDDALVSTQTRPTDLDAIGHRLDQLGTAGPGAGVTWIWTTAGLPDRYVVAYRDEAGAARRARIDGAGAVLRDRAAGEHSFLELMRAVHIDLLAGRVGHWILAGSGMLLVTNLVFGLVVAWPRRGGWRQALLPRGAGGRTARLYGLHRAVGLWVAVPALFLAVTGTLLLFEHEMRHLLDVEDVALPPNPPAGTRPVGLATAVRAGTSAIPGSRFVGTTLPSTTDASYYMWVRAPGELYRGGYGRSLVVIDANDAGIRGTYPIHDAPPADILVSALYPLHTGEAGGTPGRALGLLTGIGLLVATIYGLQLWLRRRSRR